MIWLPDPTVDHLLAVAGWPELTSDRYDVIEEIGRGGMGTVYAAIDTALGREVAIKIGNALPSSVLQQRLTREATVLARLEHPGIVPVHDLGRLADGRPFYVMKRVHGRTLQACIDAGMPLAERLRIFERVCEAVAFAHAHGIIHRDLKPGNVMVGTFGEVMVMDWGVARVLDVADRPARDSADTARAGDDGEPAPTTAASRSDTVPGTLLGTPGFMAPEQLQHTGPVDLRADVYALGAMLFALTRDATAAKDAPLRSICRCAMSVSPADRYPTATALAADVVRFRERQAVSVHPESVRERAGRVVRTYQTPILLVLAYIVMRTLIAILAGI